jgi:hypothetical protein
MEHNYSHLRKLTDYFWSAQLMTELTRKVLAQTEVHNDAVAHDLHSHNRPDGQAGTQRSRQSTLAPLENAGDINGAAYELHNMEDFWNLDNIDVGSMLECNLDPGIPNFWPDNFLEQFGMQ